MGLVSFVAARRREGGPGTVDRFREDRELKAGLEGLLLAERTRIARELHDTLLQGFFAVSMRLHTALDELPEDSPVRLQLSEVLQLVDRTVDEGRRAVEGLRLPNRLGGSLGEALARIPKEMCLQASTRFRVVVHGKERELADGPFDEVYRIGCEAILNAFRHSRAKLIEAEIEYRPTELRIAIRDDGCGIDSRQLQGRVSGHWGLLGMRERAERIGARLCLLSKVALGTEVELRVPNCVAFGQNGASR
jgi:signal transduction histidine kinase